MAKFVMLGRYSPEAIKGITGERTKKGVEIIEKAGGKVNAMLALLGNHDLLLIVDFPGIACLCQTATNSSLSARFENHQNDRLPLILCSG